MRSEFHGGLAAIDRVVVQLLGMVSEGIAAATDGFPIASVDIAQRLGRREAEIDDLYAHIETLVEHQFARQQPVARDLRFLVTVLGIVPEAERTHDLAEHIAWQGASGLAASMTPRLRGMVSEMGAITAAMWREATDAFVAHDATIAERLDAIDDQVDALGIAMYEELASGACPIAAAVDSVLVARFYERLGDHAVNVGRRICFAATGKNVQHAS